MTKQDLEKQLEQAYTALSNHKDDKATNKNVDSKTERILQQHIRYLKQLLKEQS